MSNTVRLWTVDSFTDQAFSGNPAGVCIPSEPLSDQHMQLIARELGFSETAFIAPPNDANVYPIRYFTPIKEVPLCGHATLATAKILFDQGNTDTLRL